MLVLQQHAKPQSSESVNADGCVFFNDTLARGSNKMSLTRQSSFCTNRAGALVFARSPLLI